MQLSRLMSKTILWSNQRKPNCLPCIYSAISRCFQPVGWLARSWHSLHQASTNSLYISRHEDRPLLVFMFGLCRLTLQDEEMKHWHIFSQESQLGWQNIGLKSWRFCQNCDWQASISGVAFYYLAAQQPVKKIPKAKILTFCVRWLEFNVKYD